MSIERQRRKLRGFGVFYLLLGITNIVIFSRANFDALSLFIIVVWSVSTFSVYAWSFTLLFGSDKILRKLDKKFDRLHSE